MNTTRNETLATGWKRLQLAVAVPLWLCAVFASVPPLAILFFTSTVMDWCEELWPDVFDGEAKT